MIKKILLLLVIVLGFESKAQVGVNTTDPKAQLDIRSTNQVTPSNTDGLLIPKINAFPVTNPTVDQQGMLVFLTTTVGANTPGFYYWNNPTTAWLPVKGTDGGTLDQAYDFGGAGNGRTITADNGAVNIQGAGGLLVSGKTGLGTVTPVTDVEIVGNNVTTGPFTYGNLHIRTADNYAADVGASVSLGGMFGIGTGPIFRNFASIEARKTNSDLFDQNAYLIFKTLGTGGFKERMRITASGNIGIGTDAPQNKLHFHNPTGFETFMQLTNATTGSTATDGMILGNTVAGGEAAIVNQEDTNLYFYSGLGGAGQLTVGKNGNVGIGNFDSLSLPQEKLHVEGSIRMVDGNQAAGKILTSDANGTATWQNASANAWGLLGNSGTNSATNFIGTTDVKDLILKTSNTEQVRLLANGNFGIGVPNPVERFQVAGRSLFTNGFSADNAALIYRNDTDYMFLGPQSGSSADGGALALFGSTNVSGGNAGGIDLNIPGSQVRMNHTNGSYIFRANSTSGYTATFELNDVGLQIGHNSASRDIVFNTASSERMRLTAAGDLGIGIPNPVGQLQLSLNEGIKPGSNAWTIVSDQRLKNVKGIFTKGLNEIIQLNPIRYNYKNNGERKFEQEVLNTEFAGFLAQEVQPIFPDAVGTDADGFLSFNIHPILIAYVNAIKELDIKTKELQQENKALNEKLNLQEKKLNNLLERLEKLEAKTQQD